MSRSFGGQGFQGLPRPLEGQGQTPELQQQLARRLRLIEGVEQPVSSGASPANASGPLRLVKSQPIQQPAGVRRAALPLTSQTTTRSDVTFRSAPAGSMCENGALAAVGSLTRKNEELTLKAERMKEKLLRDAGSMPLEERNALLAETDALLEETEQAGVESRSFMNLPPEDRHAEVYAEIRELRRERSELREELALGRRPTSAGKTPNASGDQAAALRQMREETQQQMQELNAATLRCLREEIEALKNENASLRHESRRQAEASAAERGDEHQRLLQENARLISEKSQLQEQLDAAHQSAPGDAGGPESRLRHVMTSRAATITDMKQAIGSAEALLDEVRRELGRRVLNEKRAAIELLYQAIEKAEGAPLAAALERARQAEVDATDLEKGEAKLEEIRSMTEEQKIAKAAHLVEVDRKKTAFLLVKKDDAAALKEFIDSLEEGVRWQDWRDYAGRNMWKCSQELCAHAVRQMLREELGLGDEHQTRRRGSSVQEERYRQNLDQAQAAVKKHVTELDIEESKDEKEEKSEVSGLPDESIAAVAYSGDSRPSSPSSPQGERQPRASFTRMISDFSADEERALQSSAQGAVVRDDAEALKDVLDRVDVDVWSQWTNKAGKDLLTLSEERGSMTAYSFLARTLGILTEQKRDTFEERETVWVFFPGEVQARRATILEDTPEESEEIHVEMWEGDTGSQMVERCLVRKMGG